MSSGLEDRFQTLHEIVVAARHALAPGPWDYLVGGTETETTLRRNRQALDSVAFRPRVLRDVSSIDSTGTWLRQPVQHVRDVRSLLLLKLVFAERLGVDTRPMLEEQHDAIAAAVAALEQRIDGSQGSEEILLRFRLESTRAVLRFVEGTLAAEPLSSEAAI